MMQQRKAFTLMELLVVIGIIGILAGMVFAGVQVAKKAGLKTKTQSILGQVSTALLSYKTLNGSYPDSYGPAAPLDAYGAIFGSPTAPKLATAITTKLEWESINQLLSLQLASCGQSFSPVIVDAWGRVIRYRPAKYYPFDDANAKVLIDKDTGVPARDGFQLWSIGPNNNDEYGEKKYGGVTGDDLTSWSQ